MYVYEYIWWVVDRALLEAAMPGVGAAALLTRLRPGGRCFALLCIYNGMSAPHRGEAGCGKALSQRAPSKPNAQAGRITKGNPLNPLAMESHYSPPL